MEHSRKFGLPANVIEKDYVLGWLLAGIYANKNLSSKWTFKGGTCLKKCYFETYRFSEDLDFTLTDYNHLNNDFLIANFTSIAKWVYDYSGIDIPIESIKFDMYNNPRGNFSAMGKIGYRGPLQRKNSLSRIKLDLTADEILVQNPSQRTVHHPYSDVPNTGIKTLCYCYEEIFAEKTRALIERARPRDLYDVIHLYRHRSNPQLNLNHYITVKTLQDKCTYKKIILPKLQNIQNALEPNKIKAEWKDMLAHQLPALPPFEQFWEELPKLFEWIYGAMNEIKPLPTIATSTSPYASTQNLSFEESLAPLETIKFAAVNHLCIEITYIKENASQQNYLIEPYSLRRSKNGRIILYAVKHSSGDVRAFRLDRIQSANTSTTTFTPKFSVEIDTFSDVISY